MHKAYIPAGLLGKVTNQVAYLLSSIAWQVTIKKVKRRTGYAPLKLTYLRSIIGRNGAKAAIDESIRKRYVKTDGAWMAGKSSMGYRVERPWSEQRVEPVILPDEIGDRIKKLQDYQIAAAIANSPGRQFVYDNLASLGFRSGIVRVMASHANDIHRLNSRIQAVGRIGDRNWWFSADPESGRVYHNATTLPRDCRKLLLMDGQPTAETDIANCQPFLLSTVYPGPSAERTRFLDLCISGQFYEHINGLFEQPFADRDALKVEIYRQIMYGGIWHTQQANYRAFASQWPILGREIASRKLGQGGKRRLPVEMQRAEADIMLGQVVPRLMNELPGVRALTIHDSLLLPVRHANDAAELIRQELTARFGACPPVRVK